MELKKTITSIFMVPTLAIDKEKLKSNNFLNAYVKDARKDIQYDRKRPHHRIRPETWSLRLLILTKGCSLR